MFFRNEYHFLSNMYPCKVEIIINGQIMQFKCAESAFQAQKNPNLASMFVELNGFEAKKLGRKITITSSDWDEKVRLIAMENVLLAKFSQNPLLKEKLLNVKEPIIEENTWNDTFWGVCNGKGENMLGKILEKIKLSYLIISFLDKKIIKGGKKDD